MITEARVIGITPGIVQSNDFEAIKKSFETTLDLLILRFASEKEFNKNFSTFVTLGKDLKKQVLVNSRHINLISQNFNLHLTSKDLMKYNERPISQNNILGASCHNEEEVLRANKIECDYLLISPINHSKGKSGLGWDNFNSLTSLSSRPCFALGGMKKKDLPKALAHGGNGIAGISFIKDQS